MQNSSTILKKLEDHYQHITPLLMRDMFAENPLRFKQFSLSVENILLDYSKNRITADTLSLLCEFANSIQLTEKINQLFSGQLLNNSERRPALHTALRASANETILVNGNNIIPEIEAARKKMQFISDAISQQQWQGFSNQPITDIVNIGIGGSNLGPKMVTAALKAYSHKQLRCHFISNIDGAHITEVLKSLNPHNTLFIISSKYFTTQETLCNANTAKQWLLQATQNPSAIAKHFIAVTARASRAIDFGIFPENILPLWDWVGGRFSVWSAVGLSIALMIGFENFQQFLQGACAMDQHFKNAPFSQNMPVILALLNFWYGQFFKANSFAILPYDHQLRWLPQYLQQAHMESHGKSVRQDGSAINYTSAVIWGGVGTDGQHTFHQMLHQGTQIIPVDFIIGLQAPHPLKNHHEILFANCLSQSQALMKGKTYQETFAELISAGSSENEAKFLAPHKVIPGNRPSNTLVFSKLTPYTLGALLALYEHKIFIQSALWDINCFDQWGVELGKQLANPILHDLQNGKKSTNYDASTQGLIEVYKKLM